MKNHTFTISAKSSEEFLEMEKKLETLPKIILDQIEKAEQCAVGIKCVFKKAYPGEIKVTLPYSRQVSDFDDYIGIYCDKKRAGKNVYAMPGGGAQHQVFFGDEKGYIACIGLDLKTSRKNSGKYTMTGQGRHGDIIMDGFKMDGVKFMSCESIYGKEWMDKHYPIEEN